MITNYYKNIIPIETLLIMNYELNVLSNYNNFIFI